MLFFAFFFNVYQQDIDFQEKNSSTLCSNQGLIESALSVRKRAEGKKTGFERVALENHNLVTSRGCQLGDRSAAELFLKQAFLITNVFGFPNYLLIVL